MIAERPKIIMSDTIKINLYRIENCIDFDSRAVSLVVVCISCIRLIKVY